MFIHPICSVSKANYGEEHSCLLATQQGLLKLMNKRSLTQQNRILQLIAIILPIFVAEVGKTDRDKSRSPNLLRVQTSEDDTGRKEDIA